MTRKLHSSILQHISARRKPPVLFDFQEIIELTMFMIRLLIVGETGVGKTSLLVRFNEGNFYSDQKTTIGVDYKAKEIDIDGEIVKLQVKLS